MSLQIVKLDSCVNILSGFAFKSKYFNSNQEGMPLIRIRNVVESKIETYYSGEYDDQYLIKKGDLLVGMDGDFNRQKWSNEPALLNQRVCKITPIATMMDSSYLYHLLPKELDLIHAVTPCVTVKHLSVQKIKDIELILPSLPEQQRIANILDKAEAITQKREQALMLCDEFLRATFLDMFGDPVTNPKGWIHQKLDEVIVNIKAGKSLAGDSKPANENELGVLKVSAVSYGFFQPQENKKIEKAVDREKLIFPKKGDFLFSRANTRELVGATCIVQNDFEHVFLPDKLWLIDVDSEKVSAYYLHFLMLEPKFKDKLTSQATGTSGSMLNISQKKFVNTIAPIPPIELQQKFSEIVEKVNAIKARIQHAQELPLFDALSQQAFKGELTQ